MSFSVKFQSSAEDDLARLFEFLLDNAETVADVDRAQEDLDTLRDAILAKLAAMPWSFRKAGDGSRSTRRELVIPVRRLGYVALYEIASEQLVIILAVRHQLEQDFR